MTTLTPDRIAEMLEIDRLRDAHHDAICAGYSAWPDAEDIPSDPVSIIHNLAAERDAAQEALAKVTAERDESAAALSHEHQLWNEARELAFNLRNELSACEAERDALREAMTCARDLIGEGHSTGRDNRHGWEMNGERAYLVDACAFDELSNAVATLTKGQTP